MQLNHRLVISLFISLVFSFAPADEMPQNETNPLDPGLGVVHFQEPHYSAEFCRLVLETAPQEIKDRLELLKNSACPHVLKPRRFLLFGPSGSGKTTLAHVIARELCMPVIFINAGLLGNEYKNSAAQNLRRAIEPYIKLNCVIIIDEIDCLLKESENEKNPDIDTPKQVWEIFDVCDKYPNLILIGITNDIRGMPDPLQTRLTGDTIEIPSIDSLEMRKKSILFHINNALFTCDTKYVDALCKKTRKLSQRELEKMALAAMSIAFLRDNSKQEVSKADFEKAYAQITKSRSLLKKIKWSDYEKHLQYGLQIANLVVSVASLITNWRMAWLSYVLNKQTFEFQKENAATSNAYAEKNLVQAKELGDRAHVDTLTGIEHGDTNSAKGIAQAADHFEKGQIAQQKLANESKTHADELNNKTTAHSVDQFNKGQIFHLQLANDGKYHAEQMAAESKAHSNELFEKNSKLTLSCAKQSMDHAQNLTNQTIASSEKLASASIAASNSTAKTANQTSIDIAQIQSRTSHHQAGVSAAQSFNSFLYQPSATPQPKTYRQLAAEKGIW